MQPVHRLRLYTLVAAMNGVALLLCTSGCASSPAAPEANRANATPAPEPVPEKILVDAIKPLAGPKRVVAVGKFDCIGSFRQNFGDWDIGGGISAMLASALSESEQFIVVERSYLSQVLSEQELKNQRAVAETTGPQLGQLTGVQLLVYGASGIPCHAGADARWADAVAGMGGCDAGAGRGAGSSG